MLLHQIFMNIDNIINIINIIINIKVVRVTI